MVEAPPGFQAAPAHEAHERRRLSSAERRTANALGALQAGADPLAVAIARDAA